MVLKNSGYTLILYLQYSQGRRKPEWAPGHNLRAGPLRYFYFQQVILKWINQTQTIAFALYLVIYSLITECPTDTPTRHTDRHTTPTKCHQFDRVAVSRGRSPRILGVPPKFLRPGGPETPFPVLSNKYFCQKRFGKLIVISHLFSRLVFTAGWKCMGGY